MLKGDFSTHFAPKHMHKDLQLMGGLAEELKVGLPVTDAIRALFATTEQAGHSELDYSAIFKLLLESRPQ